MKRARVLLVQLAIVAAAVPPIAQAVRSTKPPRFAVPIWKGHAGEAPKFQMELLPGSGAPFVHAPSVATLRNGDLLAMWYAGSGEMQRDVGIVASRRDQKTGLWSTPALIETAAATSDAIGVRAKSVGNPVLHVSKSGVTVFYTAVVIGGWSGGTVCMKHSTDGVSWSKASRVYASPFFDVSVLVKGKPVPYDDGSIALPVYHQFLRRWSGLLRVAPDGSVVDASRIEGPNPMIQPWIVPLSFTRAIALMRWSSLMPGNVAIASTEDGGRSWSEGVRTSIMHRDSAVAGERLSDGSILAVYNNMTWDRRELALIRSTDEGVRWSKPWPIEHDHEPPAWFLREYSYPYVLQTPDGMIHVFYTWRRLRIAHVAFNEAWVHANDQLKEMRR
jgi:predicted neuraminidase